MVDTVRAACQFPGMVHHVWASLWLFAILLVSPPLAAEESAAHTFCRMSWASQPDRLTECVNDQIAGARSVVRWLDWAKRTNDPAAQHIISTFEACSQRWSPDYRQIDACLRAGSPLSPPGS